ncbi:tetratricopeptide (TPR) repeat protein/transcriptional regulator with XRE-family HTH domain [Streptomyces sp. V3I8]|uniref:helix-turn-helix transcriptional regulator n=1 Tax=Streptomyces sp. V3I8 TaxID=3042279 RepID=UPI0027839165|nr:helix-turn-helix transcriptional regulator [Streptomyces sp. V3I8]MDQ1041579.1 tetratricopeptide (TPR) repeat protein/transcriptional regulator with XRE-family HTH domain [Streptomyces sp. V3I8]
MTDRRGPEDPTRPDPRRVATRQDFGRELTLTRQASGLSVRQVAKAAGVPVSTLGGYFAGTHLPALQPPDLLDRILVAAKVTDPAALEDWRRAYWRVRHGASRAPAAEPQAPDRAPLYTAAGVTPVAVSIRPPLERLGGEPSVRGRDRLLDALARAALTSGHAHEAPRIHVLHGLGGCGKSTVALAAVRHATASGIRTWWIPAEDAATVTAGMLALAVELGASPDRLRVGSLPDIVWRLLDELDEPWLLVMDDVDDPTAALAVTGSGLTDGAGWLRPARRTTGTLLLTTRDGSATTWGRRRPDWLRLHRIGVLAPEYGADVLLELAGPRAGDPAEARALSARLGGLPLALAFAGRYLAESQDIPPGLASPGLPRDFHGYREALNRGLHDELFALPPDGAPAARRAHAAVGRAWELSLDLLAERGFAGARPLLQTLSCLGQAPIPYELLLRADLLAAAPPFAGVQARGIWDSLRALDGLGLVTLSHSGTAQTLTLHPLVRDMSRRHPQVLGHLDDYLALTTALLTPVVEGADPKAPSTWERWRLLADHCAAPLDLIGDRPGETPVPFPAALRLANRAANYLRAAGHLAQAEAAGLRSLAATRHRLPDGHPLVLGIRHDLARTAYDQGRLAAADTLFREVLASRLAVLGPEHPDTLTTQHYLARTLRNRGLLDEAEALFAATLRARTALLGERHPDTLTSRNGVADMLRARDRFAEALTAYKSVLALRTQVLGERHPATLVTGQYLAEVRQELDQPGATEAELRRLAAINQEVRGADHPRTLAVRQSLVEALHDTGRASEAQALALPLVAACRRLLGEAHPATLRARYRLALLCSDLGASDDAERELQAVVIDRQRVLGPHHPHTRMSQATLAAIRQQAEGRASAGRGDHTHPHSDRRTDSTHV